VLAVQEWAAHCHGADTDLTAQCYTVAGMGSPRESVEQHRGVIPRRVRVVVQSCGVRALNARTREQERGRRARGSPRARRTSPVGASSPRARRTSPEGALCCIALVGRRGPPRLQSRGACVLGLWIDSCFVFFQVLSGFPRLLRGPLWLSPTYKTNSCLNN
jgi:hypothetical protein